MSPSCWLVSSATVFCDRTSDFIGFGDGLKDSIAQARRRSWFQSPVPRVKRRKRRNGFRQSGADWETAAAWVKMETESSVLIRPLIATPAQWVSRSRAETDVLQLGADLTNDTTLHPKMTAGLSSVPPYTASQNDRRPVQRTPRVNCCANVVSGITTKTCLIRRLQRHQPPRV